MYNCIAWVLGMSDRWIDPLPPYGTYWPAELPRDYGISTFRALFTLFGFVACANVDFEEGWEKIAIWIDDADEFAHVAKVIGPGLFSSKIGEYEDVTHSLEGMGESCYGSIGLWMKWPADANRKG
jgi:hypothetical protein